MISALSHHFFGDRGAQPAPGPWPATRSVADEASVTATSVAGRPICRRGAFARGAAREARSACRLRPQRCRSGISRSSRRVPEIPCRAPISAAIHSPGAARGNGGETRRAAAHGHAAPPPPYVASRHLACGHAPERASSNRSADELRPAVRNGTSRECPGPEAAQDRSGNAHSRRNRCAGLIRMACILQ